MLAVNSDDSCCVPSMYPMIVLASKCTIVKVCKTKLFTPSYTSTFFVTISRSAGSGNVPGAKIHVENRSSGSSSISMSLGRVLLSAPLFLLFLVATCVMPSGSAGWGVHVAYNCVQQSHVCHVCCLHSVYWSEKDITSRPKTP